MIFYWLLLLAVLGGYGYFIWKLSLKKVGPLFTYRKAWVLSQIQRIGIGAFLLFVLVTTILVKPIGKTIWCSYKGYEHSVETRRDWISGVCSYKGPNGAWIPIERLLGFPEGDKDQKENNHSSLDQTNN